MPKLKTNSSAKKRFKATGGGGFKHKAQHRQHLKTSKSPKRKRQARGNKMVSDSDHHYVSRLLGLK